MSLAATSKELWETLATTYGSASRGHIKQLKTRFRAITKGPQSISEFMNAIKMVSDELALLGEPVKNEDLIERVLDGLGDPNYQGVIDAINAHETSISFAELHEKLINRELTVKAQPILGSFPASAHAVSSRPTYNSHRQTSNHYQQNRSNYTPRSSTSHHTHTPNNTTSPKPFLGRCQ